MLACDSTPQLYKPKRKRDDSDDDLPKPRRLHAEENGSSGGGGSSSHGNGSQIKRSHSLARYFEEGERLLNNEVSYADNVSALSVTCTTVVGDYTSEVLTGAAQSEQ